MDDLIGKELGPFKVVAALGQGGMARVYKAYQPSIGRYVALKVLPQQYTGDPAFVKRFEQEAHTIANLEHPNILPVFDFGQADGYMYIAMRLIEGGTLRELLHGQPLPATRIRQVMAQVGDALDYAHSLGVIHRDVKPSNILIDSRGNCLLADFGIARAAAAASSAHLTNPGDMIGTAAYASPEQATGRPLDARSDLYSLGVVLFEMATGRVPFDAGSPLATAVQHVQAPVPPPRSINPQVPPALERVIVKALAKNPDDRYTSAGDMLAAVRAALPGVSEDVPTAPGAHAGGSGAHVDPAPTQPATVIVPRPGGSRRSGLLLGLGTLAVLACLLGALGGVWLIGRLQPARGTSTPATNEATAAATAAATAPAPAPATALATTLAATAPAALVTRPAEQGIARAAPAGSITLDGAFDDWPGDRSTWSPVNNVVFGSGAWSGPDDLSAQFRSAWSPQGLYLAISVRDNVFRAAPPGDLLFKGDSVEILFDRDLQGDYDAPTADGDDYQVGAGAADDSFAALNVYRWLPRAQAGTAALQGAARKTASGYDMELLIPWSVLGMSDGTVQPNTSYGFALSVNDNDGSEAAQQKMVSSSPARVSFNRPPQWGTLILAP